MKKLLCLFCSVLLAFGLLGGLPVAAAGTVTASVSESAVTVGSSVTVTIQYAGEEGIGSMDASLQYNAQVFEYVSCAGATANGSAGMVAISYFATEAVPPKTLTVTLTFKAIAAGSGDFAVDTKMYDDYDNLLGELKKSLTAAASNPTLSGDANLASLKPSKGTLTPKFDKNTTEYTISVDYTVTSLTLSATTSHQDAKTSISGKNSLDVGKNTRVVTVTAPNGSTKKYTVVITREKQKTTTSGSTTGTTGTTTAPPPPDALDVEVNGVLMTVPDTQPAVDAPAGFKWDNTSVNGVEVPAAKNETTGMVLLYLTDTTTKKSAFFIYDTVAGEFAPFRQLTVAGGAYVLHDLPESENLPLGTVLGTIPHGESAVPAYVYEDTALADYAILWVTAPDGHTGLYTYDRSDGSLQRYHLVTPPAQDTVTDPEPVDPEPKPGAFGAFILANQRVILLVAAACAALALLVAVVFVVIRMSAGGRSKGRH